MDSAKVATSERKMLAVSPSVHAGIVKFAGQLSQSGQDASIREATDKALIVGLSALGIEVSDAPANAI